MMVEFEKNVYFPDDKASAIVQADNTKSQLKIKEIEFEIIQEIYLNGSHWHGQFEILENQDRSGVKPFEKGDMKKMELDLNKIKYKTNPYLVKSKGLFSDTYYDLTPDEEFFMSGMAPQCHSLYIHNEYFLNVNIKYSACNYCCSAEPTQRIPLTILPRVNPSTYGFEAPDGYTS